MKHCPKCNSEMALTNIEQEVSLQTYDAPCVIEKILALECSNPSCGNVEITDPLYVAHEILIFDRRGLDVLVQEVLDEEGKSWNILADMFGMTKQNLHKQINNTTKVNFQLCCEIAYRLNRKLNECFRYYPVVKKKGRFYLDKETQLF